ncbi:nucleoside-diphosphate kinase, partial [Patescibacteria group bacterium]|nr:nucleoside-diphosphate kinase [Patescibacteria group bacterium]
MEKTVILVKPDGVQRGLIGQIMARFEKAGFKMIAAKLVWLNDELLNQWYAHHLDKPFFPALAAFMNETPVMAMVWQGEDVVSQVRRMSGATDPAKAEKGTIRADLGTEIQRNVVHISDSP